jgi:serine/threonine-protein kinase
VGHGGMGSVWRAWDPELGREVALKLLAGWAPDSERKLLAEARAQARISHPNVCEIYDVGRANSHGYIAMRLVDGPTLRKVAPTLNLEARVALVRDVAEAVHAAHRTGLVHRDLKSDNILVERDRDGRLTPFVVDFGLARPLDSDGTVSIRISGTPAYMAPEQATDDGRPLDRRTDVYGLGAVLYEALGGAAPFAGSNHMTTLLRVLTEQPTPLRRLEPSVPVDLEAIVMRCLEKQPDHRYSSTRALAEDLSRFLDGETVSARPPGLVEQMRRMLYRRRREVGFAAVVLLIVAIGAGAAIHSRWQTREQTRWAQDFIERVKEVEAVRRYAALAGGPAGSPWRERADHTLRGLETEIDEIGDVAAGPGQYALGRAALALGDPSGARAHLERAISRGWDGPSVRWTLGRSLAEIYRSNLEALERISEPEMRRAERARLVRELRDPALALLRSGRAAAPDETDFVEGLVAACEERYGDAYAALDRAWREAPWLYEAKMLEARLRIEESWAAMNDGESHRAADLLRSATLPARLAIDTAPGDARPLIIEGNRLRTLATLPTSTPSEADQELDEALEACDAAVEIDPRSASAHQARGLVLMTRGRISLAQGEDPNAALEAAAGEAETATDLDPTDWESYHLAAFAAELRARWDFRRGGDAQPHFESSQRALENGIRQCPWSAPLHARLGRLLYLEGLYQRSRGHDPEPSFVAAIHAFEAAMELAPTYAPGFSNLGNVWTALAEGSISRGEDPEDQLAQAASALKKAVDCAPLLAAHHSNLGNVFLTQAEWRLENGRDPSDALDEAQAQYREALRLQPDYGIATFNLGQSLRFRSRWLLMQHHDPSSVTTTALDVLADAGRLLPGDADVDKERARIQIIRAEWALRTGSDPAPAVDACRAALAAGVAVNPADVEVDRIRAELDQLLAEESSPEDRGSEPR